MNEFLLILAAHIFTTMAAFFFHFKNQGQNDGDC